MIIKCKRCGKVGVLPTKYLEQNKQYILRYNRFGGFCLDCTTMKEALSGRAVVVPNN